MFGPPGINQGSKTFQNAWNAPRFLTYSQIISFEYFKNQAPLRYLNPHF